jgi:G3E family GTPase
LLIESTGISEPLPKAQTFSYIDENLNIDLSKISKLDTMVTVVDAFNFLKDYGSADTIYGKGLNDDKEDDRSIVNLLTEQVEFVNVIVINKINLIFDNEVVELVAIIKKLNPEAKILRSN